MKDPQSENFLDSIELTAKTRKEIATEYGISVKTLMKKLKANTVEIEKGLLFPCTVKVIYSVLGLPPSKSKKL